MRSSGKILFPQLRDGTGIVQCVVLKNAISPELWEALKGLGQRSVESGRTQLDARVTTRVEGDRGPGELPLYHEEVLVEVGEGHLSKMDTIVDPLVVSDLATVVWAPHRHTQAVDSLLRLAQVILVDSEQWPDPAFAAQRAASSRLGHMSWTSPGCGRHPGVSGWRRPSIPPSGSGSCPRSARSPPATGPSR